ncbi:pyroglutamyl-peptidase I [Bdellovibrio sp. HCB2-146]|uniref:pyroglutamyl-peptidase I family protein n=1 Tax=Bdellovibrio sp. HCB2-146 TaxID=3394362 RepID=UPI0039BC82CF
MSKKRILVTGFEPFGGESINPSQLLLEKLQRESLFLDDVQFELLPVSFEKAAVTCLQLLREHAYDHVIQLGQAGGRKTICLERVALNWVESKLQDEEGFSPDGGTISEKAPAAYLNNLDLNKLRDELKNRNHQVTVSLSAGSFVCNYLYFKSQEFVQNQKLATSVLFIHVPYLPEQANSKAEATPSMEFEAMYAGIRDLIVLLKKIPKR